MLLLLFTRSDRVTFFSLFLFPTPLETTNHAAEWISVPLWPPPVRSLPNCSSPAPGALAEAGCLTLGCLSRRELLTLQLACSLVHIDSLSPYHVKLSLLCPQGSGSNEARSNALSLKKRILRPNSVNNQQCNLGKVTFPTWT